LPADASSLARKIGAAGRSLLSIIDDILDFSKIEAGRLEIEHEPFYLGEVLDNLGTIMSAYALGKSIELIIAPPPTGDYYLRGDAQRLSQVLINLVGNAIKFTDSGDVETAVRVVEETEQLITFRFAVRDTGIGISPEKQQHIFAPFSQADTTITRRFGGTGLGLTICRRLVSLMGGELGIISEPGRGSEFWFTLSFDRVPGVRLSSLEMAHLDVLIADDNPTALAALCNAAVGLGWKATAVASGEAAIKYMLSTPAAIALETVLIFDWQMPGMDGFAAARAIKAALKDGHNPIIIMVTAYSRDELLSHPDSAVADAVLTKPVTPSSLYAAVAKAQQKRGGGVVPATKWQRLQRLNGVRILVVDDSEINREVAQRVLAAEGAHIVLANNGRLAVDWLNAHVGEIDMVLMDLQMPVMDGYEASRLIRRTPELADLPVIALTAGAFKEQQDAAKSAGMSDYISKPFDVEAAIALILGYTSRLAPSASAGVTMRDPVTQHHPEDLPGLAVGRGLTIWQDASVYRQYLRKFVRDYGGSVREMADAERTVAATLAHKLTGAAGSLALAEIAALAAEVDHILRTGGDPATALAKLALAMKTSLESIARYAPLDPSADIRPVDGDDDGTRLAPLMVRLLHAFNADSPDAVRPVLAELNKLLPPAHLAELGNALESFDFRSGEVATKALAAQLRISLQV
jgi:CheY-like chemotaxis protein